MNTIKSPQKNHTIIPEKTADTAPHQNITNDGPRIIFQIWLSDTEDSRLPDELTAPKQSWIDNNPGWTHHLITNENLEEYLAGFHQNEAVRAALNDLENPVAKADLLRLAALVTHGGMFVNINLQCLRPIETWVDLSKNLFLVSKSNTPDKPRLINGLIWAKPGNPWLSSILQDALENIRTRHSSNLYDLAGTPVFNKFIAPILHQTTIESQAIQQSSWHHLIWQNNFRSVPGLKYRQADKHWSKQQKTKSIFATSILDSEDWSYCPLLILAAPRTGMRHLSRYARSLGFDIPQETTIGHHGILSSSLVDTVFNIDENCVEPRATRLLKPGVGFVWNTGLDPSRRYYVADMVARLIRNPFQNIPSLILENEADNRQNASYIQRRRVIEKYFGVDIEACHNEWERAAQIYLLWNRLIEDKIPAVKTLKIEDGTALFRMLSAKLQPLEFITPLGSQATEYSGPQASGIDKPEFTKNILALLAPKTLDALNYFCKKYSYPWPE